MSGSGDYISREAAQKIICGWCGVCQNPTLHDLMHCDDICPQFAQIPAADAIEELSAYVRQIEELRKDGYYLQKTKMATCGQAIVTMPLPEPPKEERV